MKIGLTFTEELLGTKAKNPQLFDDFIARKRLDENGAADPAPDEIENARRLDSAKQAEEAGTSIFHQQEGARGIYDYQIKGYFKDACGAMNRFDKASYGGLTKLPAYKQRIDGCIEVKPRFIVIVLPPGGSWGLCERPIRMWTPQGERTALLRSEAAPAGSQIQFEIKCHEKALLPYIQQWLAYGEQRGLGQWRNGGKGRFSWTELP